MRNDEVLAWVPEPHPLSAGKGMGTCTVPLVMCRHQPVREDWKNAEFSVAALEPARHVSADLMLTHITLKMFAA